MANGILVFIEHVGGKINRATYEAIRAAQLIGTEIGQDLSAVGFGEGAGEAAAEIATKRLKTVYTIENQWLKTYTADGYTHTFRQVIEQLRLDILLMSHTYQVRDFASNITTLFTIIVI